MTSTYQRQNDSPVVTFDPEILEMSNVESRDNSKCGESGKNHSYRRHRLRRWIHTCLLVQMLYTSPARRLQPKPELNLKWEGGYSGKGLWSEITERGIDVA